MGEALQVNYPHMRVPYTRIVEYKHKPNQPPECYEKKGTVIFKEYSMAEGDPYYPVPNPDNRALYEKYREMAEQEPGVAFVGRLASYKYFNMDQDSERSGDVRQPQGDGQAPAGD